MEPEVFKKAIGHRRFSALYSIVEKGSVEYDDPRWLCRCAMAVFGEELLNVRSIRRGLLATLDSAELSDLAQRLTGQRFEKDYDNVLSLMGCQWAAGSGLAAEMARLFSIPSDYLPEVQEKAPDFELVHPQVGLPGLFEFQIDVLRSARKILEGKQGARVLVQMPTGAGKTRTAIETMMSLVAGNGIFQDDCAIIWLAHAEELCEQAVQAIRAFWQVRGKKPLQIIRLWGDHDPPSYSMRGAVVVAGFQKVHSLFSRGTAGSFSNLADYCSLVVVDEAHKLLAPTYRSSVDRLLQSSHAGLMGLTATPGRGLDAEDENRRLVKYFEGNIVRPDLGDDPIRELRNRRILAKIDRKTLVSGVLVDLSADEIRNAEKGLDLGPRVLKRLANDSDRNRLLLAEIATAVREYGPTIVFSCTRDHARLISAALNLRRVTARYLDYEVKKTTRASVVERFRAQELDVLVNFGILTTGFDAPNTRAVVISRPTSSLVLYGQMIGRALRGPRVGGSSKSILIDVVDNFRRFGGVSEVYDAFQDYWADT